jgi:hypothetical protein
MLSKSFRLCAIFRRFVLTLPVLSKLLLVLDYSPASATHCHRALRRMQCSSTKKPASPSIICSEGFAKVIQMVHRRGMMMCGERFAKVTRMVHGRGMMMWRERFARRGRMVHGRGMMMWRERFARRGRIVHGRGMMMWHERLTRRGRIVLRPQQAPPPPRDEEDAE